VPLIYFDGKTGQIGETFWEPLDAVPKKKLNNILTTTGATSG